MRRGPADVQAIGPLIVGVDVARFGNDKSCITFRKGRVVYPQIVFGQCDVVDVAGRVKEAINNWGEAPSQIAVDTIGIGSGVADILRRDFRRIVVDVNSSLRLSDGQNYNLRARMWRDMDDWGYSFRLGSAQQWFEQDADDARPAVAYLFEKVGAIHFRHSHVGDDEVDLLLFENLQPGTSAFGDERPVAGRAQQPP